MKRDLEDEGKGKVRAKWEYTKDTRAQVLSEWTDKYILFLFIKTKLTVNPNRNYQQLQ